MDYTFYINVRDDEINPQTGRLKPPINYTVSNMSNILTNETAKAILDGRKYRVEDSCTCRELLVDGLTFQLLKYGTFANLNLLSKVYVSITCSLSSRLFDWIQRTFGNNKASIDISYIDRNFLISMPVSAVSVTYISHVLFYAKYGYSIEGYFKYLKDVTHETPITTDMLIKATLLYGNDLTTILTSFATYLAKVNTPPWFALDTKYQTGHNGVANTINELIYTRYPSYFRRFIEHYNSDLYYKLSDSLKASLKSVGYNPQVPNLDW